jgi:tRNA(adenine34) deaminase
MKENSKNDLYYMQQALEQAQKALGCDEVPIGAIVVDAQGTIIGRGYNQVSRRSQQSAHAEMIAINKASKKIKDWRLNGATMYSTLEPCLMCMGLIQLSRVDKVVFGARSHLFGFRLDKAGEIRLYNKDIEIVEGVLAAEAIEILQRFFKQKRKNSD